MNRYTSLDEETVKKIEELNAHKGENVIYTGGWGMDEPEPAVFTGAEWAEEKDAIIVAVDCADGHSHWGYVDQIEFIGG